MTENLLIDGKVYKQYLWDSEEEFEKEVIIHSRELFGDESIYTSIVASSYPADKKDFRFLNSSSLSNSNRKTLSLNHDISRFD